ncbi:MULTISPECIES: hypothetical protein [unclassified Bacteroides]|nr:hypothetical protein [Bacteroides sp.]MDC2634432.1 hypothetical protein [Bacteroides ovatus]
MEQVQRGQWGHRIIFSHTHMRAYNKVENNETMGEEGDGGEE